MLRRPPRPIQGWNSNHPWLQDVIREHKPSIVVEIGSWKGASVVTMADQMRVLGHNGVILAVDTWLGSSEHWMDPCYRADLDHLYGQFLNNIADFGLTGYVLPVRLDSLNAARLFRYMTIRPDVIHLDGGHDYQSVSSDLRAWWPLLNDYGVFLGDDYYRTGECPEVKQAIDLFLFGHKLESMDGKCRVIKNAA